MILKENGYFIQDLDVLEICEQFGTPLYVYDGEKIAQQVASLKQAFLDVNLKIKYACKANTNISILKLMNRLGVELDVVSPQEMHLGLHSGFNPSQITFTSSGVSFDEIEEAINNKVLVNIDNLPTLKLFGQKYGNSVPVMLRIRPNVIGGGNIKIMTGHKDSKFGIAIEQKDQILSIVSEFDINVIGLHQHTGSDIKDGNTFVSAATVMLDLAFSFPNLKYMDFGGGFKVAYKEDDVSTNMQDLGKKLTKKFKDFCSKYGKDLELWFEPGKYLVSESGYLFAKANLVKENPNKTLIGLNTGLNHLIRPMMYDAYHEVINVSKPNKAASQMYDIVGYMCETDDIAKERKMPSADQNDILCILNAGAYGFTMASNYNSRFKPAEVLIFENKAFLVRKREEFSDILNNQILIEF